MADRSAFENRAESESIVTQACKVVRTGIDSNPVRADGRLFAEGAALFLDLIVLEDDHNFA